MKKVIWIFMRDLKGSLREFILIYMIIAPLLLTIGLKFFIPDAQSASLQFALDAGLDRKIVEEFQKYGKVELYNAKADMVNRIIGIDDIAGITSNERGSYQVILEGNESHDTKEIPKKVIRDMLGKNELDIEYVITDMGTNLSPIAIIGTVSLILMAIVLGGIIISLNIIEEKESQTIRSLNVTTMNKTEFIIGKSLLGFLLPIVQVYLILWILDMLYVDKFMVLGMILAGSLLSVIFGFLIGVISSSQIAGITNMKLLFITLAASIVGTILLPPSTHYLLYWIPSYWFFVGFRDVIMKTASWYQIGIDVSWILGLTAVIFLVLKRRIAKGLV
ncbi:ABC transporter permease [Lutispora sp.]|uniref:ABC transporter permease n=1 Tax=Lutispora sp. TaxID=2828727 RepID=UPI002B1F9A1F|nr:ABC transporter permease [Lutispora sp.]MEA4962236.1 ABC transporter permease [Lutispora sp.]